MVGKKVGLVIAVTALTMFAMGRVESLARHRGFAGSSAWAQSWDDAADDAASNSPTGTPPDVTGNYSGNVTDHRFGPGTLELDITSQGGSSGGKLSGTWSTDLSGGTSGALKGKVQSNSSVTLRLNIRGTCHLVAHGTFQNGDEIVGVYHAVGCGGPDHGSFDVVD